MKMRQFEIKKLGEDEWELKSLVNENSIKFKRNVKLAKAIQDITPNARLKMIKFLKEKGLTKDDLIDKKVKNGKIVYDETAYIELENGFIRDETANFTYELFNVVFGKTPEELTVYLGITNEDEGNRLGVEIGKTFRLRKGE